MCKIQRILKVAWQSIAADKRAKKAVVYLWATTLLYYVIGMWYPIALSNTVDGFEGLINGTKAISSGLIFGMIGLLSVAFYHSQYYMIQSYNYDIASSRIETGVRGFILRKTVEIRYDELCLPKNQDRIQILRQEYPRVCSDYLAGSVLMTLVGTFVSFVFLSVVLLRVYPWIALIVILSNIFSFLKTILEAKLNYYHVVGNMRERRWADAYAKPMYDRKSIKEIRLFGVGAYFIEKWKHFTKLVNRRTLRLNTEFTLLDIAVNVLCYGSATLALLLTCMMIRNGRASTGAVLLVYAAVTSLMDRSGQLFYACRTIFMSTSYEEMYRSFQNMQSTDGGTATDTETQQFDFEEISFNNVSFTYPGSQNPALSHFSFSIRRGEKVAIVGENGSGKSTMVSLLCGLYVPDLGKICVNGKDDKMLTAELRRRISVLFQNFGIYETTIGENIAMGANPDGLNEEELTDLCRSVGLEPWVSTLPKGIHTPLGRLEEGGIEISGGQGQKIAIARCLARKNAELYVLDEPNSALDPLAEDELYRNLLSQTDATKAVLLISHRFGACRYADRIAVMQNGTVVESGTHTELLARRGVYAQMYQSQIKYYE